MQMKTLFLALCVALALLAGCGRSKPQSSKTAEVDTSALENAATAAPPDQLPPKSTAEPVPPPAPATVSSRPGAPVFGPLPPGRDKAGDAMRQKYQEGAVKILQNTKGQELERKRLEALQNQPQGDGGSNQ
jgi:hypothetical protein